MLLGVFVGALALVPVAVAWACNPQAHISLDRTSFSPGQTITVYGSYFPGNTQIQVAGPVDGTRPKTSAGGAFTTTVTAPSQPGTYTVTASRPTGGFAAASFSIAAPPQPSPANEEAQTPARSQSAPSSSAPAQQRQEVRAPSVSRSQRAPSTPARGDSGGGGQATTGQSPVGTSAPVFAGSTAPSAAPSFTGAPATPVARALRGQGRERARSESRDRSASPSPQTALSDVWSAFEPGRTPSLASASGAPAGGTGSQLAWGIGLLGLGVFALVGGLAYTEARRRRPI